MPLYFFHLRGGANPVDDEDGWSHADDEAARTAAVTAARGLIAGEVLEGLLDLTSRIEVEDEEHHPLFTVPFASVVTRC